MMLVNFPFVMGLVIAIGVISYMATIYTGDYYIVVIGILAMATILAIWFVNTPLLDCCQNCTINYFNSS